MIRLTFPKCNDEKGLVGVCIKKKHKLGER